MNSQKVFGFFNNFSVGLETIPGAHARYGSWRAGLLCSRRDNQDLFLPYNGFLNNIQSI